MATRWNQNFYLGKLWKQVRDAYIARVHGLCEQCGAPGFIVHHKLHLTQENINNPMIAYAEENLEYLCNACHNRAHGQGDTVGDGLAFDENGNLFQLIPPGEAR